MSGRVWVLDLRAPAPMRTTNAARRLHWGTTSGERRALRDVAYAAARGLPKGLAKIRVEVCCHFPDRRPRDASNLGDQVGKPIVDALGPDRLVKDARQPGGFRREPGAGVVADDGQAYVDGPVMSVGPSVEKRRWPYGRAVVTITDLSGEGERC